MVRDYDIMLSLVHLIGFKCSFTLVVTGFYVLLPVDQARTHLEQIFELGVAFLVKSRLNNNKKRGQQQRTNHNLTS